MPLELDTWNDGLIARIARWGDLIAAAFVVPGVLGLAKCGRNIACKALALVSDTRQIRGLLSRNTYVTSIAMGVFVALGVMNLDSAPTSLLAGAGILGLASGFAFQGPGAGITSGLDVAVRRPFGNDDLIATLGHTGQNSVPIRALDFGVAGEGGPWQRICPGPSPAQAMGSRPEAPLGAAPAPWPPLPKPVLNT